jgi:hypothetical protein
MATRGRATFQKRQKEMARKEKRRAKEERKAQRRAAAENLDPGGVQQAPMEAAPPAEIPVPTAAEN